MRFFLAAAFLILSQSAQAQIEFANAVVDTPNCSGVIIVKGPDKAYGVSAAHCCGELNSQFQITTKGGRKSMARWIVVDRSKDLALFCAWSKDVEGVAHVLSPLPDSPEWTAIGYPAGHRGQAVKSLEYRATKVIQGTDGFSGDRNIFQLRAGTFGRGDSGGGVFASRERSGTAGLVGIMSHGGISASTNGQLVAFVEASYPKMDKTCRDCIEKWDTVPPPPPERDMRPGQHDLPEYLDSDRERGLLLINLMLKIDELEAKIVELESRPSGGDGRPGPPGIAGLDGKDGATGKQGADGRDGQAGPSGKDAQLDYDKLTAEVKKRLPPIPSSFSIRPRTKSEE